MNIENKYLKYKMKYLELKNQKGGSAEIDEIKHSLNEIKEMIITHNKFQNRFQETIDMKFKVVTEKQKIIFDLVKKNTEILAILRRMSGEGPIMAQDPTLKHVSKSDSDDV